MTQLKNRLPAALAFALIMFLYFPVFNGSYPTANAAGSSFSFASAGDHGSSLTSGDGLASLNRLSTLGADFYLAVGDLSYSSSITGDTWCSQFKSTFNNIEVGAGNHDTGENGVTDTSSTRSYERYVNNCPHALGTPMTCGPVTGQCYGKEYYFDYPSTAPLARFIMISPKIFNVTGVCTSNCSSATGQPCTDTYGCWPYIKNDLHYNWVSNAIDNARTAGIQWVIVGTHKDCITAGTNTCSIGTDLFSMMVSKKVDLILQGHDHSYQRSKQLVLNSGCAGFTASNSYPIYNSNCIADDGSRGFYTTGVGTVVVIEGTFGAGLIKVNDTSVNGGANAAQAPYFVKLMGSNTLGAGHGFVRYTVSADRIDVQTWFSGTFADSFTIGAGQPVTPRFSWSPTNPPLGQVVAFSATATGGNPPYSFNWVFGDGVTASGAGANHIYVQAQTYTVKLTATDVSGSTGTSQNFIAVGSWNGAVSCSPVQSTLEGVIGNVSIQRVATDPTSKGADYSGGGFKLAGNLPFGSNPSTWSSSKRNLSPPCAVSGTASFVELHNVNVKFVNVEDCATVYDVSNGGGVYPNGWKSCDTTFNIETPGFSTCPTCYMHHIHSEIDRDWNASRVAPLPAPASGQTIDVQGFVFWDHDHVNESWHSFSGWELHPLTAWRVSRAPITGDFTFTPALPNVNQAVTFTGTASGGTSPYKFTWDFGDGTNATGNPVSHTYPAGSYNVHLAAKDAVGTVGTASHQVTVVDQPPTLSFTADRTSPFKGQPVTLTISSSDPDGTVTSLRINWGDGTVHTLAGTATTDSYSYSRIGSFTINVTATDNGGKTTSKTSIETITDAAPVARFTESLTTAPTGTAISFDASSSSDSDGTITGYNWDFGDGAKATGISVSHSYSTAGNYLVTLTVTDNATLTASTTSTKTITDRPPVVSFTESSTTVSTGSSITLTISASDPDGTVSSLKVVWGDGTVDNLSGTTTTDSHAYGTAGSYTVYVNATDNAGLTTKSASATNAITDRPPTASFSESATSVLTGVSISFDASASSDPDGTMATYSWNFGDGFTGTGKMVTHSYSTAGFFTVTLTVTDNSGSTGSATSTKTTTDRPPIAEFSESATSVKIGTAISFDASTSSDPDGTVTSYAWNFGDGSTGAGVTISHTYAATGVFTVTLTVTDNNGNTAAATASKSVANDSPPIVSFQEDKTSALTGGTITVTYSSSDPDGTIVQVTVDWGDGTVHNFATASGSDSHSYVAAGSYTVAVTAKDDFGLTTSKSAVKSIGDRPPVASFTESTSSALTSVSISFDATGSSDPDGTITSYSWNFGDGNTGTGKTMIHSYAAAGTYTVTLTVTDNTGSTDSTTSSKSVTDRPPVASFTESTTTASTSVSISFDAAASSDPDGTIVSYSWNFGDGVSAVGVTTVHSYATSGTFTVTLTVTDDSGNPGTTSAVKTITSDQPPTASFTESSTQVSTGASISFDASSSSDPDGTVNSYSWDFGDGITGTGATTTHSYTASGTYSARLTVTDNTGLTGTATAVKTVTGRPPIAAFTESTTTALTGVSISFNATTSSDADGSIADYTWGFGDGSTGTGKTTTHTYATAGTYTVTLTVTDNSGSTGTTTSTKTITDRPPVASFTESVTTALTQVSIGFNAGTSVDPDGTITTYSWTFGDGGTGTGVTPTHAYAAAGTYTVTLTVTDNNGSTGSTTSTKTIQGRPPVASFTETATTALTQVSISFDASASAEPDGTIATYSWNFGDGSTSTGKTTTHSYTAAGAYTVTLTVTDNSGSTGSTTSTKTITDRPPVAKFTESATTVLTAVSITFNATSSSDPDGTIAAYSWNFGDGATASGVILSHSYATAGTYTVTLKVTDNSGSTASTTATKSVQDRPPTVTVAASPSVTTVGNTVTLTISSKDPDGTVVTTKVDWGDGTVHTFSGAATTDSHAYSKLGTFKVVVTVTDNNGSTGSATTSVQVKKR